MHIGTYLLRSQFNFLQLLPEMQPDATVGDPGNEIISHVSIKTNNNSYYYQLAYIVPPFSKISEAMHP